MKHRKDSKGRVLKEGETQRPNGTYAWRYEDLNGKRKSIYAKTLVELREKKEEIQRNLLNGVGTSNSQLVFIDIVKRCVDIQHYEKMNTVEHYKTLIRLISKYPVANKKIKNIKKSQCIDFIKDLNKNVSDNTTKSVHNLCRRAMQLAIDDGLVGVNPFDFAITNMLLHKKKKIEAFTNEEFNSLIDFMSNDYDYKFYVPHFKFLRETGLRISEFMGLTIHDVDFQNRTVTINKQILKEKWEPKFYVSAPKTISSNAVLPLTSVALESIKEIMGDCKKTVSMCSRDGCEQFDGFFVCGKKGTMIKSNDWYSLFKRIEKAYNMANPSTPIILNPHKLRHTAATKFLTDGLSVPATQMMMRHSRADTTLNVYTHLTQKDVFKEFNRVYS